MASVELWLSVDRVRFFLVPDAFALPLGDFEIQTTHEGRRRVALEAIRVFEVTEEQALRIAKDELGQTLDKLKHDIDAGLAGLRQRLDERDRTPVQDDTTLTLNAAPAMLALLKNLPGVIVNSLAHDAQRVETAKATMADLQRRLKEAGIDLDERFTAFPARLAALREDVRKQKS
jgi:hypothetical protein